MNFSILNLKFSVVLLVFSISSVGVVFGQCDQHWSWQYPAVQGNDLNDVKILTSNAAMAVGDRGTIIKTTDGGTSWTVDHCVNSIDNFHALSFPDSLNGWIAGENGIIMQTTSGGDQWNLQSSGTNQHLHSLIFLDASYGWAVGDTGTIVMTSDGGTTWSDQSRGDTSNFNDVQFTDMLNGWIIGTHGIILHTSDAGNSWMEQTIDRDITLTSIDMIDSMVGYIVGEKGFRLKTTDGGLTWQNISINQYEYLTDLSFINASNGWVVLRSGYLSITTDGGQTWSNESFRYTIESIDFLNSDVGIIVGQSGTVFFTHDGGNNWDSLNIKEYPYQYYDVNFVNSNTGWVAGTEILKTTDGGQTWIEQDFPTNKTVLKLHFINDNEGWAAGIVGLMLYTDDGGQTWEEQLTPSPAILHSVYFLNENEGWASGYDLNGGILFHTSDGGQNWEDVSSEVSDAFAIWNVHFSDLQKGWAVGPSGLHSTTDGGDTWTYYPDSINLLWDVEFINNDTGFISCSDGIVLRTTDGGNNWTEYLTGLDKVHLDDIDFLNDSIGWAAGDNGVVLHTTDGGDNWAVEHSITAKTLSGINFVNDSLGWAVGGKHILKYQGEMMTGIADHTPIQYIKLNTYPNPSHGQVMAEYDAKTSGLIQLSLSDINGKVVYRNQENVQAGKNTLELDLEEISQGLYFLKIFSSETENRNIHMSKIVIH